MASVVLPSGITIEYDSTGDPDAPVLLLIMGFTAQMIDWPEGFVARLAALGRRVIRFDNRDCGLSTKLDGVMVDMGAIVAAMFADDSPAAAAIAPYTLSDMAADAVGLLDALGIASADVVGASLGGMVAQTIAIEHPSKVRTLTSIMSSTGEVEFGMGTPEAMTALLTPAPSDRDGYIEASSRWKVWQSNRYASDENNRARATRSYDRSFYPQGASRQLAAVVASGSRADALRALDVSTLVIHGLDDQLITPSGGERTAELVPNARLVLVEDMGHDVPEPLWPTIVGAIGDHLTAAAAV
jgi:pimeloyl-ACP methyl ester carboxylesterase